MNLKVPPHSLEAEQAVLGGLLLDPEAWEDISSVLEPSTFYKPSHQKIYETLQALRNQNEPIDLVATTNALKEKDCLEQIGGVTYLTKLLEKTPSAANILHHAKIVKEKKVIRDVIHVCQGIIERGFQQDFDMISDFLNQSEADIFAVGEAQKVSGEMMPADQLLELSLQ